VNHHCRRYFTTTAIRQPAATIGAFSSCIYLILVHPAPGVVAGRSITARLMLTLMSVVLAEDAFFDSTTSILLQFPLGHHG
jgi:hypothetical protein